MDDTRGLASTMAVVASTMFAWVLRTEVYGRHDACMIGCCL